MSAADEARAEAWGEFYRAGMGLRQTQAFIAGWNAGAEWQASRKVEVTKETVERAARRMAERGWQRRRLAILRECR